MTETILDRIRRWWRYKRECARQDRRMHIWDDLRIKDRARVQAEQIVDEQFVRIRKKLDRDAEFRDQDLLDWAQETLRKEIDRAKEDMRREMREEIRAAFGMDTPERTERPGVSGVSPHH